MVPALNNQRTIQIQVPPDAEIGDTLTFHISGADLNITVPDGSKPGDVLQIQLEGDDGNNIDEAGTENDYGDQIFTRDDVSAGDSAGKSEKISLHPSVNINLVMNGFVPSEKNGNDVSLYDAKGENSTCQADGTHAMVWPAGMYLATCLSSPALENLITESQVVLELGSGTGIAGIAFAAVASQTLLRREDKADKQIYLTDLPTALPLIRYNLKANKQYISSGLSLEQNVHVKALRWGASEVPWSFQGDRNISNKVDLIIGSDLLYDASLETYKSLVQTIDYFFVSRETMEGNPRKESQQSYGKIVLSVRWRKPEEERLFFEFMETAGYTFTLLKNSDTVFGGICSSGCDLNWKDFGNPACAKSNDFFTSTSVQAGGRAKLLNEVIEKDVARMDENEYNLFESKFTQIYVGCRK
mmetsp:Transcript_12880/g.28442  ORF Transcript_12880/g.28442 Transcript_12880/m.28442 type:complete len:414 (-) Transcript_12880:182-1423(-)